MPRTATSGSEFALNAGTKAGYSEMSWGLERSTIVRRTTGVKFIRNLALIMVGGFIALVIVGAAMGPRQSASTGSATPA